MQEMLNRLIVIGGSDAQPLSPDTLALLSPNRVTRQMRGGGYVTTVVDQDAQIGGDIPTRFLLSESEELVASDGHHITLHPGAISGVTTSGRIVDGLMLSGKKVRDEYLSDWLNSPQWLRFRAEAMDRGEAVFEGIRRLRVRCGSTAVNNDRTIFFQRRGFGGGAFFAREAFVEAQLADDYLLLDDGIPVERYTAEFYNKRPFIGVRPDRIRPGEVFDLTITVCDPESFDNLLITRDDGLRTPDIRVKVNDLDITPALAEKFAGFNPFGFPSNATSPYPGFRLVWPQMKIDQEMPLKIAVEVRDGLGNVNETEKRYTISRLGGLLDLSDMPRGLYGVPLEGLPYMSPLGFNAAIPDNYTSSYCEGTDKFGRLPRMLDPWLKEAKRLGLMTIPAWVGLGEMACPACPWQARIDRCLYDKDTGAPLIDLGDVDVISVVDEPMPIRTDILWTPGAPESREGCAFLEPPPGQTGSFPCWPLSSAAEGFIKASHYIHWFVPADKPEDKIDAWQVFFFDTEYRGSYRDHPEWQNRVQSMCWYLTTLRGDGSLIPLHINMLVQRGWDIDYRKPSFATQVRKCVWARFMPYCHRFSVDIYPTKCNLPISRAALFMDEMREARLMMWGAIPWDGDCEYQQTEPWVVDHQWRDLGLPHLWWILDCSDACGWIPDPEASAHWDEACTRPGSKCLTLQEYKASAYLALTHGAQGFLTFAFPNTLRGIWNPPKATLPPDGGWYQDKENCGSMPATLQETNYELELLSPVVNSELDDKNVTIHEEPAVESLGPRPLGPAGQMVTVPSAQKYVLAAPSGLPHDPVDGYPFGVHCPGRTATTPDKVLLYGYGANYWVIAVNADSQAYDVTFRVPWVPGYHRSARGLDFWEVPGRLVNVMFERRRIPLALPRLPHPEYVEFTDRFGPYERHVYEVPGDVFPPGPRPPFGLVLASVIAERLHVV